MGETICLVYTSVNFYSEIPGNMLLNHLYMPCHTASLYISAKKEQVWRNSLLLLHRTLPHWLYNLFTSTSSVKGVELTKDTPNLIWRTLMSCCLIVTASVTKAQHLQPPHPKYGGGRVFYERPLFDKYILQFLKNCTFHASYMLKFKVHWEEHKIL
jgi:hypothetical protein